MLAITPHTSLPIETSASFKAPCPPPTKVIITPQAWKQRRALKKKPQHVTDLKFVGSTKGELLSTLPHCTNLFKLSIKRGDFADSSVEALIIRLDRLGKLTQLSLANNDLTDEGAYNLFSKTANKLEKIDLSGNYISNEMKASLQKEAKAKGILLKI
jgi:hypothetical protein